MAPPERTSFELVALATLGRRTVAYDLCLPRDEKPT
jgi:hypothetical protein